LRSWSCFLPLTLAYDLQAGRAVPHGLAVYPSPSSPAVYSGSSFVYPALTVWPFVPLAALPIWLATALFFMIVVGAVLTASFLGSERDPVIAVLVLATSFTLTGLQLGTLSPLLPRQLPTPFSRQRNAGQHHVGR
jgi:hypothetical protein